MADPVAQNIASNLKQLRATRGLSQAQLSQAAGVPRPTIASLEAGDSNPTVTVLVKVAAAFQVSVESLLHPPRATTRHYPAASLPARKRGDCVVRPVLPDAFGALELDRMEIAPGGRMIGAPHKSGTREYLTCESGEIELYVAGESWRLRPGDVVVFRGDQKHSYRNLGAKPAVGYSFILVGSIPA